MVLHCGEKTVSGHFPTKTWGSGGAMLANTGNQGVWVGHTHPEISRMVLLSWLSIDTVWLDLDQAGQQYSATE